MTAQRWWVAAFARWQARIDAIKGQIQALSLAVTAFSTFSLVLQGFGLGRYVPILGAVGAFGLPAYAYLFFEGGVWNQVSRDRADMSSNFAGPASRISTEMQARAIAVGLTGEELTPEQRQAIKAESDAVFEEYRDGYQLDESGDRVRQGMPADD
jgi:hypothetical protein